jgi:hypothetical protein
LARLVYRRAGYVRIIVVHDVGPERMPPHTVASYVWAVLKVRALRRELDQALICVEQFKTALMATSQADALWTEAQAFLKELEAETALDDAHSGS